jgi:hypothetical protein
MKASESNANSDSDLELDKGKWIIYIEPNATIATKIVQQEEPEEPEEREHLFHS